MKRPADLTQLIEELEAETGESSVETDKTSSATIHTEYSGSGDKGLPITEKECKLLFNSTDTVEQLFEALGRPKDATITLHNLVLEDDIIVALERTFAAIDEA